LFEFMNQDKISHFFAIYDLQHHREKTLVWVALSNNTIVGYMMEYNKRILYMRGRGCATSLLRNSNLTTPMFNVEHQHFPAVNDLYEPIEPADKTTIGQVTNFTLMKTTPESSTSIIQHTVQELEKEDAQELANLLGTELPNIALDLLKGFAFGIFKGDNLISVAASPNVLEDLAIIRGVYTAPEERNKGYATSACSALVKRLHQEGKDIFLYVSKDNSAAIRVYRKIGFKESGHIFLGFTAKRKTVTPKQSSCIN